MAFFEKKETVTVNPEVAECDKKIAELVRRRADLIMQIGLKFLENNTVDALVGTPYENEAKEIVVTDKEKEFFEKRKLAVQNLRKCENCDNILVLDSAFCNKCGSKLEPLFINEVQNQNVCAKCGATYDEGAMFCTSCGNKLG